MPIFRPRKFTFFPFLILFKRIESIDLTPCVISFLVVHCLLVFVYVYVIYVNLNKEKRKLKKKKSNKKKPRAIHVV